MSMLRFLSAVKKARACRVRHDLNLRACGMDSRPGGPPPPPRGKRTGLAHHEDHRSEAQQVPRRLGERELDRKQDKTHPEGNDASAFMEPTPYNILAETPETTVGEHVHVKGLQCLKVTNSMLELVEVNPYPAAPENPTRDLVQPTGLVVTYPDFVVNKYRQGELSFERLLRVDGSFKGQLISTGDLVIGATGVVRGNIEHLREVLSDGTIIGDIQAERVRLRRSAVVIGSITCLSLSVDPDVSISGKLNVHLEAPSRLHLEGEEEAPEDEVADSFTGAFDSKVGDVEKRKNSRRDGSTKKEGSGAERDRRPKEEKGKEEPRKKKEGEGSKSKAPK